MKKLNANFFRVVNLLKDHQYHDGTSIGKVLNITRTAVWKVIKKLQNYGIQIESVKGKGYLLCEPLCLLEQDKIKYYLENKHLDIVIFENIDSTNNYLKLKKNKAIGICLSEQQTAGKGRLGRDWYSPFGKNIYMSCLYTLHKDISELAGLSLVISLAIVKTINSYQNKNDIFVKWPNDVVGLDNKKIAGSLIEIQAESHGVSHAIIGIGININMVDDDSQISQPWTSLQKIFGEYVDRNELCGKLINNLLLYLDKFTLQGLQVFKQEWQQADCLINKIITLRHAEEEIEGEVMGLNDKGHLLLKLGNGALRAFASGDTSVSRSNAPSTNGS
jgi:BirA family biotin operon repressor/biotin-[acetyl-CoA-carboxylase] ligase